MSGFGPPPADWATRYFAAVDAITKEWQNLIDALRAAGAEATMEQTGGMTMLIGWPLDETTGARVMLGTTVDSLSHERADEQPDAGWGVGVYLSDEDDCPVELVDVPGDPADPSKDTDAAVAIVAAATAAYERLRAAA